MLLCFQFPLADARGFIAGARRLDAPKWQLPEYGADFVRYIGPLQRRRSGPLQGWVSENTIAEARRALRFTRLRLPLDHGIDLLLACAFRRFLTDGVVAGKFEVGLDCWNWSRVRAAQMTADVGMLVGAALRLQVRAGRAPGTAETVELAAAGPALASLYRTASTRQVKDVPGAPSEPFTPATWWVRAGQPIVLVEYRAGAEPLSLPPHARQVPLGGATGGLSLSHFFVPYRGNDIRVWALGYTSKISLATVRRLRVYLTRLHAEHESLRLVLRSLLKKELVVEPQGEFSAALQRYVNEATRHIDRLEATPQGLFRTGVPEIAEVVRASDNPIDAAERERLFKALDDLDIRPNVDRKLRDYTAQWGNRAAFRDAMVGTFKLEDLEAICFDLGINYDEIPHDTLSKAVMRLIEYCEQRGRRQDLVARCQHYRPEQQWAAM